MWEQTIIIITTGRAGTRRLSITVRTRRAPRTQAVDERAEEVKRLTALAAASCETIRDRSAVFGRRPARNLFLILFGRPVAEGTTEEELQALLDTLASPLFGVLHGSTGDGGYRAASWLYEVSEGPGSL